MDEHLVRHYLRQRQGGKGSYAIPVFQGRGSSLKGRGYISDIWSNYLLPFLKSRVLPSLSKGAVDLYQDIKQGKKPKTAFKQRLGETVRRTVIGRGGKKRAVGSVKKKRATKKRKYGY